ncbi:MAG: allophanate hydrolase [Pseudomonadota bacterium]
MTVETLSFDLASLHAAYQLGLTPQAVVQEVGRRVSAVGDPGIFIHLRSENDLVDEAGALPPFDPDLYPLWGLPFAVKDNIDVAGVPTTAACPAYAYEPSQDAYVVARLRAAGALPVGKTNLDQFATGLVGVRSPYPVPRNAIDPKIVPGGSSSGSAVAVAQGIVTFALGTDTAGSGRVPAALNNLVGLKPTLGTLSASGVVPACRTLDTISVFALTVADAWAAYDAASGFDAADAYSRDIPVAAPGPLPAGLRVGVPDADSLVFLGDDVQAQAFDGALNRLKALGATCVEIDFQPFYDVARMLYDGTWVAERMTVIQSLLKDDPGAVHPVTRTVVGAADNYSAVDTFNGIYRLAELRRIAETALRGVDLLCVPTIPRFYSLKDLEADPIGPNSDFGTYTNFVNLLDMCAIAVPTGVRSDGRPASVTLLATAGQDAGIASLADDLHRISGGALGATAGEVSQTPILPRQSTRRDEMVLAVVGAHMSGLPLNTVLTGLGARFLEVTETSEDYQLFALAGGPPIRPGLLRVPDGAAIALELWALPSTQFGAFMATVPSPLSFGTIMLSDGRAVTGVLVEQQGIEGAQDITRFGGWRAYLSEHVA